jgi:hypothetical protein
VKKPGIEASISPVYVVPSAGIEPATKRLEGSWATGYFPLFTSISKSSDTAVRLRRD